jgi:hypothetical protein
VANEMTMLDCISTTSHATEGRAGNPTMTVLHATSTAREELNEAT